MGKEVNASTVAAEVSRLESMERNCGLSMHEEFSIKVARALFSRLQGEEQLVEQRESASTQCDLCGFITTHPAGWHFCNKKRQNG